MTTGYGVDLWGAAWGGAAAPALVWPDYLVFPAARRLRWETDPPATVIAQPAAPTLGGHYATESLSPHVVGHG